MTSPPAVVSATSTLSGVDSPNAGAGIPTIGIETNDP